MQDGFRIGQSRVDAGKVGAADRVDEHRAGTLAPELDQVGALAVPVTRRALGVHRDGPGSLP